MAVTTHTQSKHFPGTVCAVRHADIRSCVAGGITWECLLEFER